MISTMGKWNSKQKKKIIKMKRNYSNIKKRIWTDKYVHEHHVYGKNNAGFVNVGSFHNRSGVNVNRKNVWKNSYVKCTTSCKK